MKNKRIIKNIAAMYSKTQLTNGSSIATICTNIVLIGRVANVER